MADPRRRPPPPPPPPPPEHERLSMEDQEQQQQQQQDPSDGAATAAQPPQNPPSTGSESGNFKLRFCTVCASNNNRSMEAHLRLTSSPQQYPVLSFGTGSLVRLPGASLHSPNVYNFNSTSYEQMYQELKEKDKRLYSANGILNMLERNKNIKWGPERWQDWRVGVPRVGKRVIGKQSLQQQQQQQQQKRRRQQEEEGEEGEGGEEGEEAAARIEAEWSQDRGSAGAESGVVDIVFTCEERCWDAVVDDLLTRGAPLNRPVHVFNVDIKDNHEEALVGGRAILELADALNAAAREERDAYTAATAAHAAEGSTTTHLFDQGIAGREGFDERVPEILAQWQEKWPHLPALWTLAWF